MPLLITGFDDMTDEELCAAAAVLTARFEATGDEIFKALADRATDMLAHRSLREALFDRWLDAHEQARLARKRGYNSGWHAGRRARRRAETRP